MALAGSLSPGAMIVFIFYIGKLYKPMQQLSKMADAYSKAAVSYGESPGTARSPWRNQGRTRSETGPLLPR